MGLEQFKKLIKEERAKHIPDINHLVYESFIRLGFDQENSNYFYENASYVIESMRDECWERYQDYEKHFDSQMYSILIDKADFGNNLEEEGTTLKDAVIDFISEHSPYSYALHLSNTQSRRSRAGNEFERLIELVLIGAKIPFDTQGSIGENMFKAAELAKLVDLVSPGVDEYRINKRNTALISAKTTLRERWQEVGDEMSRTMAREMFLATLDENTTSNVLDLMATNNIIVVTTKRIKDNKYPEHPNVITFEDMISELNTQTQLWKNHNYSDEELKEKHDRYMVLRDNTSDLPFISNYYSELADNFRNK